MGRGFVLPAARHGALYNSQAGQAPARRTGCGARGSGAAQPGEVVGNEGAARLTRHMIGIRRGALFPGCLPGPGSVTHPAKYSLPRDQISCSARSVSLFDRRKIVSPRDRGSSCAVSLWAN